jgi:glycosyltransferase involved in cell wall biosynthesis
MLMLINDENLRNKLAAKAREAAVEKYSWQVVASRLKHIYDKIIT